jgi:hypothetical protein
MGPSSAPSLFADVPRGPRPRCSEDRDPLQRRRRRPDGYVGESARDEFSSHGGVNLDNLADESVMVVNQNLDFHFSCPFQLIVRSVLRTRILLLTRDKCRLEKFKTLQRRDIAQSSVNLGERNMLVKTSAIHPCVTRYRLTLSGESVTRPKNEVLEKVWGDKYISEARAQYR